VVISWESPEELPRNHPLHLKIYSSDQQRNSPKIDASSQRFQDDQNMVTARSVRGIYNCKSQNSGIYNPGCRSCRRYSKKETASLAREKITSVSISAFVWWRFSKKESAPAAAARIFLISSSAPNSPESR
jgi:hypothetical protein